MENFSLDQVILEEMNICERELASQFASIDQKAFFNQIKVVKAMQDAGLSERHFAQSTGYGYNDEGREVTERIVSTVFGAEKALVRPQIVSGTHAIALALYGVLRPGDELVSLTSDPYETVKSFIGYSGGLEGQGTLKDYDVSYKQLEFVNNKPDFDGISSIISSKTKVAFIQRSTGYSERSALTIEDIGKICKQVKMANSDAITIVDNCYGEFIEELEPTEVGADIIAGSLTKNPGGGIALTGGYVAGKEKYMGAIASRLTAPGIAFEVGANLGMIRPMLQGLFMAPRTVADALKNAVLTARVFEKRGYKVFPSSIAKRSDIIQAIVLGDRRKVEIYCNAIQSASPVDSYVMPIAWDMPGYQEKIIMAAGNFVSGSSIELSADAPMKEPYTVYQQGGLTFEHAKMGLYTVIKALNEM